MELTLVITAMTILALLLYRIAVVASRHKLEFHALPFDAHAQPETLQLAESKPRESRSHNLSRKQVMGLVTFLLFIAGLWVIMSQRFDDDAEKLAFGVIGSLVGFWFRPETGQEATQSATLFPDLAKIAEVEHELGVDPGSVSRMIAYLLIKHADKQAGQD